MTKKLYIITLLFALLFSACTSNKVVNNFKDDKLYVNALQNTQKTDVVIDNRINVIFTATYLNEIDSQFKNANENFIVSVYEVNSEGIDIDMLKFKLNEKSSLSIKPLPTNHVMSDKAPIKNQWATFYLVAFEKSEEKVKELKLQYKNFMVKSLEF